MDGDAPGSRMAVASKRITIIPPLRDVSVLEEFAIDWVGQENMFSQ